METKINSLQICMQKVETTLSFLEKNQKENTDLNRIEHREMLDKMEAWMSHIDANYAKKWVEEEICKLRDNKEKRNYNLVIFLSNILILVILTLIGIKVKL
jgi:hypothetical protein